MWYLRCCHVSSRGPHSERCLFCRAYGSISESTCRRVTGCMYSKIHLISFQKLHCSLAEATQRKHLKTTYFIVCSISNTECHWENNWILLYCVNCSHWEHQINKKKKKGGGRRWNVNAHYSFGSIGASECHHADWFDKVIKKSFSAGKSLDRSQWLIWDCDIMIMYYHRVHHLIDKLFNTWHKHWLLEQKQLQPIPPLCPIVYWWITSHHTSPTPCRHCFLFFIEMQPAKIDEKKTEDDFPNPTATSLLHCSGLIQSGTLFLSLRLSPSCFSSLSVFEGGHVKSITQSAQWSEAHLPVDSF